MDREQAHDADTGINSAIRYEILARGDDASSKFYIDPVLGIVRSMVTFALEGEKMYGFDVKATDREGSESGNSAVTNVFVSITLHLKGKQTDNQREQLISLHEHLIS